MSRGSAFGLLFNRFTAVLLGSLLLLVALSEIYLRRAGFLAAQPASYPCVSGDPVLNHVFQRNCEGVATAAALKTAKDVTYRTNSMGYRGHEPVKGKKSIVVIGDSYTEGFGLEENETFPAQLEAALQAAGKSDWQVLNGGTLGYSTVLYPLYYERFFLTLRPNLVLLNLDFTDFTDDPYYLQIADFDPLGHPIAFPPREIFPAWLMPYVYSNRWALMRFLHQEFNQWNLANRREEAQPSMDQLVQTEPILISPTELKAAGLENCSKPIELVARNVLSLKHRVEATGSRFVLHMYPPGYVVKPYPAQPQGISFVRNWDLKNRKDFSWACTVNPKVVDVIKAFSKRWGIFFIDSFPRVMESEAKAGYYFEQDAHWNSAGVQFVTAGVLKTLLPLFDSGKKIQKP